jgi:hypothetical protein
MSISEYLMCNLHVFLCESFSCTVHVCFCFYDSFHILWSFLTNFGSMDSNVLMYVKRHGTKWVSNIIHTFLISTQTMLLKNGKKTDCK